MPSKTISRTHLQENKTLHLNEFLTNGVLFISCRVKALTDWLQDCGRAAAQRARFTPGDAAAVGGVSAFTRRLAANTELPSPAPAHVHCVAAILWYSHDLPVSYNLRGIVSKELLRSV